MAETPAEVLRLLRERMGNAPNNAENLNRAMLAIRGGPDTGFINDMVESAASGRPRTAAHQPGTRNAPVAPSNLPPSRQDSAAGGAGRGPTIRDSGTVDSSSAAPASATLDLLGMNGENYRGQLGKPEGTKSQQVDVAGATIPVDTEGGPGKGPQVSAQGSADAKAAAMAPAGSPGIYPQELIDRLSANDQPLPFTASPLDYAAAGGAGAGLGVLRRVAPSLVGALSRSMVRAPTAETAIPNTGRQMPTGPANATPANPWMRPSSVPNSGVSPAQATAPLPPGMSAGPSQAPNPWMQPQPMPSGLANAPRPPMQPRVPGAEAAHAPLPPGMMPPPPAPARAAAAPPGPTLADLLAFVPPRSPLNAATAPRPPRVPTPTEAVAASPPRPPTAAEATAARPPGVARGKDRVRRGMGGRERD